MAFVCTLQRSTYGSYEYPSTLEMISVIASSHMTMRSSAGTERKCGRVVAAILEVGLRIEVK